MKKDEVIKKFFPSPDDTTFGKQFISSIYRAGYVIFSPEEMMGEKKKVTEEWIEEKAKEFIVRANIAIQNPEAYRQQLDITEDFIRKLVKEIVGK